jgi:hypothetical protein
MLINRFHQRGVNFPMAANVSKSLLRALSALGLAALLSATVAAAASADVRYATPAPEQKATCRQDAPCDLKTAIEGAKSGDEIVVGSGIYTLQSRVKDSATVKLNIHGDYARARPEIDSTASVGLEVDDPASTVSYLDLRDATDNASALAIGGLAEQIVARAAGAGGNACEVYGTLRDSLCVATGANGAGVYAESGTLASVTAIGTASNGFGIRNAPAAANPVAFGAIFLDATIARGGAAGADISIEPTASAAVDHWEIWNSDYVTLKELTSGLDVALTNNITTQPLFANPTATPSGPYPAFDFHQLPASPTVNPVRIDPGVGRRAIEPSELDVDREPRIFGGSIDIGADEYYVPPPPPGGGTPTTTTVSTTTPTPDRVAPVFSKLAISPTKFAAKKSGRKAKKGVKYKTSITYTLSEPAAVVMTFAQKTKGRKVGKSCKKQTAKNVKGHAACTLWVTVGSLSRNAPVGASAVAFTGKVGKKTLKPGKYRVQLVATDPSKNRSAAKTLNFTVNVG